MPCDLSWPRCLLCVLWALLWAPGATARSGVVVDDRIPAALDALLAQPEDPFFFGIPQILTAEPYAFSKERGQARCLATVGDVNGDGASDFAVGYAPGTAVAPLVVRDGRTGAALWSAGGAAVGFRSLRGLAVHEGTLLVGMSSPTGLVEARETQTGRLLWVRELAAADGLDPANISAVSFCDDLDGDGLDDVLVAAGTHVDAALALSAADGATLWSHSAGDVVYDARTAHDLDGDGLAELIIVGGDDAPFARLLKATDGTVLWSAALDGPGSVVLPMDDINGDGVKDLAVGQFNAPGSCLMSLSGADGSRLWNAQGVFNDVTDLDLIGDLLATGFSDIVIGSFDNAVTAVLALNGNNEWRREGTTNNGGSMLSVAVTDDLDGNGQPDVLTCSVDHRLYVMGGVGGQWMADFDLSAKAVAVLALPDGDGDGRAEIVVGAEGVLGLFGGAAGLADGPVVEFLPAPLGEEGLVILWAYPGTKLWGFVSIDTGSTTIPGWDQPFGLELSRTVVFHAGSAPGAGATPVLMPPFDASAVGLTLYFQAATLLSPGKGLFSDVAVLMVRP